MTAKKPVKKKTVARKSSKAGKKKSSKASALATAKHEAHVKHLEHLHHEHVLHEEHLTAIGKAPKAAFAIGDLLPVCSAQALAQSLRLAGQRVTDDELLELHHRAGGGLDAAAGVGDALAAAGLFGLAGCRAAFTPVLPQRDYEAVDVAAGKVRAEYPPELRPGHALILQVDRPGPHAVLATPAGWWSWGELFSPWACRIERAWAVSWS